MKSLTILIPSQPIFKLQYFRTLLTYRVVTPHFGNLKTRRLWKMIEINKIDTSYHKRAQIKIPKFLDSPLSKLNVE